MPIWSSSWSRTRDATRDARHPARAPVPAAAAAAALAAPGDLRRGRRSRACCSASAPASGRPARAWLAQRRRGAGRSRALAVDRRGRPRAARGLRRRPRAHRARRSCARASASRSASRCSRSTPTAARARLEQLTWVERASVVRMLPDSLYIRLIERQPLALWQRDGRFSLIDRAGAVIEGALDQSVPPASWRHLRVLVGEGAPARGRRAVRAALDRARAVGAGGRRDLGRRAALDPASRQPGRRAAARGRSAGGLAPARRQGARAGACSSARSAVIDLRFLPDRIRLRLDPSGLEDRGA